MPTFLTAILLHSASVLLGYFLASALGIKNFIERLGTGWLLGTSFITYLFFLLYAYAGVRYTAVNTILLFVGCIFGFLVLSRLNKTFSLNELRREITAHWKYWKNFPQRRIELLLIVLIAIPVIFSFIQNIHWPVVDWDAIALYDFRAKVFALTGGMEDGIIRGYFLHYPLYTSLLHTFSYVLGIRESKIWYTLFYLATLFTFYALLRRHVSQRRSLLGAFFLASMPQMFQHAQMAYTNLPHAVYASIGYLYLWEWWRNGKRLDVFIGSCMIFASTWVRLTEPFWLPAFGIMFLGGMKWRKQWPLLLFCAVMIIGLRVPWTQFVAYHDKLIINNPLQIGKGLQLPHNINELFARIPEVISFFWISVYPVIKPYVYAMVLSALHLVYKEKWQDVLEYIWFCLLLLFIFAGIFLFSFQFNGWQLIPDSAARTSMFLLPLSIYLIMKSDLWQLPQKLREK